MWEGVLVLDRHPRLYNRDKFSFPWRVFSCEILLYSCLNVSANTTVLRPLRAILVAQVSLHDQVSLRNS